MIRSPAHCQNVRYEWPTGNLQGHFQITDAAIDALERLLPTYRGTDGSHEGICFLCGHETPNLTIFTTVIAPTADHGRGHVRCTDHQIAEVTRAARQHGLGLLAQVHSHPGGHTGHSWGDDDLVFMPFDGMLSVVVPHYAARGLRPLHTLGVHQHQAGRWTLCTAESVRTGLTILPAARDLR